MRSFQRSRSCRPSRLAAILQAALLAAGLIAAPTIHRYTCTGVCCGPKFTVAGARCCGHCGHGAAGDASPASGPQRSGGCACLDDCCAWHALFTTPDAPADAAPATLVTVAPVPVPVDAPRAPGARLLPYPTGPPIAL